MDPVQALQDAADLAHDVDRPDLAERLLEARDEARELQEEARALRRRVNELEGERGERPEGARRARDRGDGGDAGNGDDGDGEGDDRGTSWRGRQ